MDRRIEAERVSLSNLRSRLLFVSPARRLQTERQRADEQGRRLEAACAHRLAFEAEKTAGLGKRLVALSPFEVLARGYAVVTRPADGSLIRSVGQLNPNEEIEVRVSDGKFGAIVNRKS